MDFADFIPSYPDTDDPALQQKLLNKKEFFDFRIQTLARQVDQPIPVGELQDHQRLIQRFLSPYTPYDELLLYHETGTGKTRAAFAATEQVLLSQTTSFQKVVFLARGPDQLGNALAELVNYAQTTPRFANLKADPDNAVSIQSQIKQALAGVYEFRTWYKFSKRGLAPFPDDDLRVTYNNTIFIVDEVHNIRNPSSVYTQLFRLFHLVPNRKVLLMSGTPMRDKVSEIGSLMNLILPLDRQMPVKEAFDARFVTRATNTIKNGDELRDFFKGRVSFLRAVPDAGVQRVYVGDFLNPAFPIEQFKYFPTQMGPEQTEGYQRAWEMDVRVIGDDDMEVEDSDRASNFYSNTRQATLFVFPDGSFGRQGYDRFVTGQSQNTLQRIVRPIERLRACSSKYAYVVEQLLDPRNANALTYVFNSLVDGSGLDLLAHILEIYGFARCRGTETTPGRRYILLTSQPKQATTGPFAAGRSTDINKLIRYFNNDRNRTGEYCRVILGSRIVSEGFTFKNVRHIHILTLHWNYTETQQAIARAIRFGSHQALLDHPTAVIPVYIYQHVSIPPSAEQPVIDLQMLEVAQKKDIFARRMTRLMKEIAFDCPLVFERNYVQADTRDARDARECDYTDPCAYRCVQTQSADNMPTRPDLGTFRLYYQENTDLEVWNAVRQYFESSSGVPVDLFAIQDALEVDWFQLVRVLSSMIRFNTPLLNARGVECTLREDHNQFYLVDNLLLPNDNVHLAWYTHSPVIVQKQSLSDLVWSKGVPIYANRIDALRAQFSEDILQSLPAPLRDAYKALRQEQVQTGVQSQEQIVQSAIQRRIPYYGTVDQNNQFRIVDLRGAEAITDVRKLKTGSRCLEAGFNIDRIVKVYFALGVDVPVPDEYVEQYPDPAAYLATKKYGPALLTDPELNLGALAPDALPGALYRIIRMLGMSKAELCNTLREWMRENQLLALIRSEPKGVKKRRVAE